MNCFFFYQGYPDQSKSFMADRRVSYKCTTVVKGQGGMHMYPSLQEMEKEKPVYRLPALQLQSESLIIITLYIPTWIYILLI